VAGIIRQTIANAIVAGELENLKLFDGLEERYKIFFAAQNGLADVFYTHKKLKGVDPTWEEISDYVTMLNELNIKRSQ
jgi:hypothetical protein